MFNKKQTRKQQIKRSSRKQFNNAKHSMRGGSPASEVVMKDSKLSPMSDFVTSPRIRKDGYNNSLDSLISAQRPQMGGSPASDLVMANLTNTPNSSTNQQTIINALNSRQPGDMNSLNLYKTTGGMMNTMTTTNGEPCNCTCSNCINNNKRLSKRSSKKSKSKSSKHGMCKCKQCNCNCMCKHCKHKQPKQPKQPKQSKQTKSNNNRKSTQQGGYSDWMSSQYSLGNINSADSGLSGNFTSQNVTSRNDLMNPASMGSAGSGYPMSSFEGANVGRTGAPF